MSDEIKVFISIFTRSRTFSFNQRLLSERFSNNKEQQIENNIKL